jgi:hypothetical protein
LIRCWRQSSRLAVGILLAIIGWFLRKDYERIEAGLKATNERLEQELKNERDARAKDRHELRDELNAERLQRHAFEVAVAKEYVSSAELEKALQPFSRTLEGSARRSERSSTSSIRRRTSIEAGTTDVDASWMDPRDLARADRRAVSLRAAPPQRALHALPWARIAASTTRTRRSATTARTSRR